MDFTQGRKVQSRMHELIPGGSHTYSKGDDQFPYLAPPIISHAKGAYCWDLDGNKFLDWPMGNRVMILGHADPVVNKAVVQAIDGGLNFTRPGILEYELAEFLVDLWPCADMVKFGKNGSDVTTAAIKLARAHTGRKYVAVCKDHPFFAIHDWFIGSTEINSGIIEEHRQHTLKFSYNNLQSLKDLVASHPNDIAAVILEPVKMDEPTDNFLAELREYTAKQGIVLIFDEMISGMRFGEKGAHDSYGVYPDLVCFGKAISNGFSCSVLGGKREIMELGGLEHKKERVFLLSQTHGSETTGLAATLATIREYQKRGTKEKIVELGSELKRGCTEIVERHGLQAHVHVLGFAQNPQLGCSTAEGLPWPEFYTLLHQKLLAKGVMMPWISITDAHTRQDVAESLNALDDSLCELAKSVDDAEQIANELVGPAVKPVFRKFN